MARARTGGGSTYAWALAIFGVGFFICLVLAIIFWAQLSTANQQASEARNKLAQFASAQEQNNPQYKSLTSPSNNGGRHATVVGALADQNSKLKKAVLGNPDASLKTVMQQVQNLKVSTSLTHRIQSLQSKLNNAKQQLKEAQDNAQQAREKAQQALGQQKQLAGSYQQSISQLKNQIDQLKQDLAGWKGKAKNVANDLQKQYQQMVQQKDQKIQGMQNTVRQAKAQVKQIKGKLDELTSQRGNGGPKLTQADGKITTIVSGQNEVYINRGSNDRITLGMTFNVFNQGQLVNLRRNIAGGANVQGKATVQVVQVQPNSSLAKVVTLQRGQQIREGDELVNLVYDPNKVYKFYIYGNFNINHQGEATTQDRKRIQQMVNQWGGRIADHLSYDVDFLVLGAEPALPASLPDSVVDPQRIQQHVQAVKTYKQYQNLVGKARSMNIPILNQNRFLDLVGFYQR